MDDLENIINTNFNPTKAEIFEHLSFTSKILTENKIKHWILYGTLLGAIRESDIISYDYDFDLGVYWEDTEKILALNNKFTDKKYKFEKGFGTLYSVKNKKNREYLWRVSIKVMYNENPVGDIYIYKKCEDGFLRRYDPTNKIYFWPNSTFPNFLVEELESLSINNSLFPAPRCSQVLIEYYYGPLWKTPIRSASQDGENHPDYDFYGNYKYSNLEYFLKFLKDHYNIELKPSFGFENFEYVFPLEHIEWIKKNEIV